MMTVIGEALVDLVDAGDGTTFTAHCGGSPLNVAVGLARLGAPTALMARLGSDAFGRRLRGHAAANGVDLRAAPAAAEPTTLAVVSLDGTGRASYDFWIDGTADWQWTDVELQRVPSGTRLLHTGSLASWLAPGAARIGELIDRLQREGEVLLSYDPNVRPRLLGAPVQARRLIERSVAHSHVVKASDEDLAWLYAGRSVDEIAAAWLALGAHLVVVTQGPDGALAFRPDRPALHRPGRSINLIDTVGAGDAFMSGLLAALADAGIDSPAGLRRLDEPSVLTKIIDTAVTVSGLTCERAGADPPTRAELDAAMAE